QKGNRLILWLRRFHVTRPAGMQFHRLLQGACSGFGFPLTVQDSTFRRSLAMSAVKMQILATPLMLVLLVVMMVMYRGLARAFGLPDQLSAPILPGLGGLLFLGVWITACDGLGHRWLPAARVRSPETGRCARKNFETNPPDHQAKGLAP